MTDVIVTRKGIRAVTMAGDGGKQTSRNTSSPARQDVLNGDKEEQEVVYSCFTNNSRAAVFIDPERTILFANSTGDQLLAEAQYLQNNAGRLQTAHSSNREAFLEAMKSAFDGASRGVGLIRHATRPEHVGAFSIAANDERSAAAVSFLPPWTVGAQRAALMFEPYDLTPAEKHIAECLISGYSLSDIAELNDISLSTVKSHVKRIYQKTLVKSRIEFMNQFMLLVAVWL